MRDPFRNCPVLVTGANGFIGIHLVRRLLELGAKVHALFREPSPSFQCSVKSRKAVPGKLTIHFADITNFSSLRHAVRKAAPKKIFHLAGKVDTSRTSEIAELCLKTNTQGTFNLLEAAGESQVRSFIFASTTEVYGNNPIPFREDQRTDPPSPYAISKAAAEQFCNYFNKTRGMPVTILRMSSCYGPHQPSPKLVSSIFSACLRNKSGVLRLASGKQRRDFLYVEDAVEGLILAAASPHLSGKIFNLAGNQSHSIKEVVELICMLTGSRPKIHWDSVPGRTNENEEWKTDCSKAREFLKWSAKYDLKTGLKKTWRWWQNGENDPY